MFRALRYPSFDLAEFPATPGHGAELAVPVARADDPDALELARREAFEAGYAEGVLAGRAEAARAAEIRLAEALPPALAALGAAAGEVQAVRQGCERDAYLLVRAAVRQLLPTLADQALGHEIAALVGELVRNAPAPRIEVRAAPGTHALIGRLSGPALDGVSLSVDASLPEGSVACHWTGGAARFDGQRIKDSVLAILDRRLEELGAAPGAVPTALPPVRQAHPQKDA